MSLGVGQVPSPYLSHSFLNCKWDDRVIMMLQGDAACKGPNLLWFTSLSTESTAAVMYARPGYTTRPEYPGVTLGQKWVYHQTCVWCHPKDMH